MFPFNKPYFDDDILKSVSQCFTNQKFSGDGPFTKESSRLLEQKLNAKKILLTTSCTHALEMTALLIDLKPDDEVIAPSFTFVSTVNAFVLRGAKIVFVDIRPDTMNINESLIEAAVTPKTKAIIPVHYAGVACEMDSIMAIAKKHNLYVIEDAAQGMMAKYKGVDLGTIGHLGCLSFHETKNYHSGEGGALIINDESFSARAEIIREKGTNRSRFLRGEVDKYTWVDQGSSYLMSDINAAVLHPQIGKAEVINKKRLELWSHYFNLLKPLQSKGFIDLPVIPVGVVHNAHMFYIKLRDLEERTRLMDFLKNRGISTAFHYVPLHSTETGQKYGEFHGNDQFTTRESERLLRLPMYFDLKLEEVELIVSEISGYFSTR